MDDEQGTRRLVAAARDLLPLAQRILGISGSMRGPGYVDLPIEARAFCLYAACLGVAHFLDKEGAMRGMNTEAGRALAPEIASLLKGLATDLGPEPTKN